MARRRRAPQLCVDLGGLIAKLGAAVSSSKNDDAPRWNRYYAAVLIHLAAWIVGLYAFSRYFGVAE